MTCASRAVPPTRWADFSAEAGIAAGTFADVARWADIVVVAVKGTAAESALRTAGADTLRQSGYRHVHREITEIREKI